MSPATSVAVSAFPVTMSVTMSVTMMPWFPAPPTMPPPTPTLRSFDFDVFMFLKYKDGFVRDNFFVADANSEKRFYRVGAVMAVFLPGAGGVQGDVQGEEEDVGYLGIKIKIILKNFEDEILKVS